jgi:hypothetical protein
MTETKREFTQEQAQLMYRALFVLTHGMLEGQAAGYAQDVLSHVDELNAPQAPVASDTPTRYVVEQWLSEERNTTIYRIRQVGDICSLPIEYVTEDGAQAVADRLNEGDDS